MLKSDEVKTTYKLFSDEPEVNVYKIHPDIGDVFKVGDFLQECIEGLFMDYDGHGRFIVTINKEKYEIDDIGFSIDNDAVYYKGEYATGIFDFCNNLGIKELIWYNK